MCQMSMKFPVMFDQNPIRTLDKIVEKQVTTKYLSKLNLQRKCQGPNKNSKDNDLGNKKHATQKTFEQGVPYWCDADADANADVDSIAVKQYMYVDPHPMGGLKSLLKIIQFRQLRREGCDNHTVCKTSKP